jgi:hypothetical protein
MSTEQLQEFAPYIIECASGGAIRFSLDPDELHVRLDYTASHPSESSVWWPMAATYNAGNGNSSAGFLAVVSLDTWRDGLEAWFAELVERLSAAADEATLTILRSDAPMDATRAAAVTLKLTRARERVESMAKVGARALATHDEIAAWIAADDRRSIPPSGRGVHGPGGGARAEAAVVAAVGRSDGLAVGRRGRSRRAADRGSEP